LNGTALVYSVGHGVRPAAEFLELLRVHRIGQLVDVRRFPQSRRHPHFSRERLAGSLERAGIDYLHLGEDLGGFREGGYPDFLATPAFARGLLALEEAVRVRVTAFMCSEKLPWRCHRRFIAESLVRRGFRVLHILERDRIWDPELALLPP